MEYYKIEAMNWSTLRAMAVSPAAFRWAASHPREDTQAMLLGRAIHAALLEPAEYRARYAERPEGLDLRTTAGREWRAAVEGLEVLTVEQAATVRACVDAVLAHGPARSLLVDSRTEVVAEWMVDGVRCKGRLDAITSTAVVDVKTCRDLARFERDSAERLYHAQVAWYLRGAQAAGLVTQEAEAFIIAVETAPPFDVGALRLPAYVLAAGYRVWQRLLATWQECERAGLWPGRYPSVTDLKLPRWADPDPSEEGW